MLVGCNIPIKTNGNNITFGKGEVKLWSDFDGTLFPVNNHQLENENVVLKLKKYFESIIKFFNDSKGDAQCNITTGRNFISFYQIFNNLKNKGIKVINPDKLVTADGKDVFVKSDSSDGPDFKNADKTKQKEIYRLTNWDGKQVRQIVIELFEQLDIPLGQPRNSNPPIKDIIFPVLRNDGDLQIDIDIPQKMLSDKFINTIINGLKKELDDKKIKYFMHFEDYDPHFARGPSIIIIPKLEGDSLNKSYDIRKALKQAQKEEDLVIVAGDYVNDYEMLNPESYVTRPEDIKDLPLKSIIVGDNPELLQLADKYPDKFVVTEKFNLLDGIKKAIKDYSTTNPLFELKESIKNQL